MKHSSNELLEKYFEFLIEKISGPEFSSLMNTFGKLLYHIYYKQFISFNEEDNLRILDAQALRKEFLKTFDISKDDARCILNDYKDICSCLEIMVSLTFRMIQIMTADYDYHDIYRLFCTMIINLGLSLYDDEKYDGVLVNHILNDWIYRNYNIHLGYGNLFIFRHPPENLNQMSLWRQACLFLNEYDI